MKPGDMVKAKNTNCYGIFVGLRTFKPSSNEDQRQEYTCAEVMWYDRNAPNGDRISTIQTDLLEVCDK